MHFLFLLQTIVFGTVSDDSGQAVVGALVGVEALRLQGTSVARGAYSISVDRPGTYIVYARALGYSPASQAVRLGSGDSLRLDFRLGPVSQELEPLIVTAEEPLPRGVMRGFEERRRMGFGRFVTRDMLEEREHDTVSGILRSMAGVRMVRRPGDCGGGYSAATGRGIAAVEFSAKASTAAATCGGGKPMAAACYMSIYLDGVRIWAPGSPDPPDFEQMRNKQYEGMEVYRGPAELPVQYQGTGAACGAILLWTRVG